MSPEIRAPFTALQFPEPTAHDDVVSFLVTLRAQLIHPMTDAQRWHAITKIDELAEILA